MELKNTPFHLLAGILFGLLALLQLFTLMGYFSICGLLALAAYCAMAAVTLLQRRDVFTAGAFGLALLPPLLSLFLPYTAKLPCLLTLLEYLAIFGIALALLTSYLPSLGELARKLWFLPAALGALTFVVQGIYSFTTWLITHHNAGTSVLDSLLTAAALFFAGLWIVHPEGFPQRPPAFTRPEEATEEGALPLSLYCDLLKHTLLLVFTFGVWLFLWVYRVTGALNQVKSAPYRNPTTKLLLCLFVPCYYVYWTYQSAQRVDRLSRSVGLASELTLPCLLLSLFLPILSPILLQERLNALIDGPLPDEEPQSYQETANALRVFKDLLDSGVINQEDYDAKKKQLLSR